MPKYKVLHVKHVTVKSLTVPKHIQTVLFITSEVILHGSRKHSVCHYSDLLWVEVHALHFNLLQFISGFYSPYWGKGIGNGFLKHLPTSNTRYASELYADRKP